VKRAHACQPRSQKVLRRLIQLLEKRGLANDAEEKGKLLSWVESGFQCLTSFETLPAGIGFPDDETII
jgi:hypothetical protein